MEVGGLHFRLTLKGNLYNQLAIQSFFSPDQASIEDQFTSYRRCVPKGKPFHRGAVLQYQAGCLSLGNQQKRVQVQFQIKTTLILYLKMKKKSLNEAEVKQVYLENYGNLGSFGSFLLKQQVTVKCAANAETDTYPTPLNAKV